MMSTTGLHASNNLSSYNNLSKYPFTPTQWQELEQQALIYKYMSSGIPIPSDLLLPIKRSSFNNFFPHPPPTMVPTWSCYQQLGGVGGGGGGGYNSNIGRRAAEDPEPGRCRRTDGKKWRCSKEAYPNSKYCERHMHRGKNRSRKPVENPAITQSSSSLNITTPATHIITSNSSTYPFFYPYSSPPHSDYSSWELRPLGLGEPRQRREEEEEKHCFVLGADFKQEHQRQVKERDFFDGWTSTNTGTSGTNNTNNSQKSKGLPWMGFNHHQGDSSSTQGPSSASSCSKTQLTISIPMGLHDFPQ